MLWEQKQLYDTPSRLLHGLTAHQSSPPETSPLGCLLLPPAP